MKRIPLTQGKFALVDDEDYEKVNKYKWCVFLGESGYYRVMRKQMNKDGTETTIIMARFIIDAPKGMYVDHRNHNTLDNRKSKLRICTSSQNTANQIKRPNLLSKYKGVSYNKKRKKWVAYITKNYKMYHLGYFDNEIDAARIYNEYAKKYFGEFAYLNNIGGKE